MSSKVKIHNLIVVVFFLSYPLAIYMRFTDTITGQLIANFVMLASLTTLYIVKSDNLNYWFILCLILVGVGDYFFIMDNLIYSICFFLLMLAGMMKIIVDFLGKISIAKFLLPTFFFFVFFLIVFWLIDENITGFVALEVIFGTFLTFVGVLTFILMAEKRNLCSKMLFYGVFLFLISASFVAISSVIENIDFLEILVLTLYFASLFLICRAMIYKSDVIVSFDYKSAIGILFSSFIIISLVFVAVNDIQVINYVQPICFLLFPVFYIAYGKKINLIFVAYLVLIFLMETLLLIFHDDFVVLVLLLSVLSHLLMIRLVFSLKHIKIVDTIPYVLLLLVSYLLMYYMILTTEKNVFYIVFILTHSLMTASGFANYIIKMYMANYLLWLGLSFGVLNVLIISSNPIDSGVNVYGFITNIISYYLITHSFIIRSYRLQ